MTDELRDEQDTRDGEEARDDHALVARAAGELVATSDEELPVLEAFQKFLEAERRRARKRTIIMATSFSAALVAIVLAGIVYGLSIIRPVREEFVSLRSTMDRSARQRARSEDRFGSAIEQLVRDGKAIKKSLSGERQVLAETRSELQIKADNIEAQMDATRKMISDLQLQNTRLQNELTDVKKEVPVLALEMETVLGKIKDSKTPEPPAAPSPTGQVATATTGQPPSLPAEPQPIRTAAINSIDMVILPAGSDDPISWRISIPE